MCCSVPAFAVTVTVDVVGGGGPPDDPPPPPQLARRASPRTPAATKGTTPRRLLQPTRQSAKANADPGNNDNQPRGGAKAAIEVETVSVVEATPPDGVTLVGEKLHDAPAGRPEQLKVTVEANPFTGVTDTVAVFGCPDEIDNDVGETPTE